MLDALGQTDLEQSQQETPTEDGTLITQSSKTQTCIRISLFCDYDKVLEPAGATVLAAMTLALKTMADNSTQLTNTNGRQGITQDCPQSLQQNEQSTESRIGVSHPILTSLPMRHVKDTKTVPF